MKIISSKEIEETLKLGWEIVEEHAENLKNFRI